MEMTMDTAPPDMSAPMVKATEAELDASRFIGGFKPAEWAGTTLGTAASLSRDQLSAIGTYITEYQTDLKSKTQDDAGVILGKKILSTHKDRFMHAFGPYTEDQALDLFKNKPMQVIQGLIAGIPYSTPTMPMSIAQAIKQYSYIIPGASVGKGGGMYRTIKIPKGVTNRPTKYRPPNPVMILMQITNFVWHLVGLPGMAPYYVSQAAMAYYRNLINFEPTKLTMTKADVSQIMDALQNNHPSLMQLFYDSQIYSKATAIAKENSRAQIAAARVAFKNKLGEINTFDAGQQFFGQLMATSSTIKVVPKTDATTVKRNMLLSYANTPAKPVKLPRGVGYYKVGSGAPIKAVKMPMGETYSYKEGKWDGYEQAYNEEEVKKAEAFLASKASAAQAFETAQANADAAKAKELLKKQGMYTTGYTPAQIAEMESAIAKQKSSMAV